MAGPLPHARRRIEREAVLGGRLAAVPHSLNATDPLLGRLIPEWCVGGLVVA